MSKQSSKQNTKPATKQSEKKGGKVGEKPVKTIQTTLATSSTPPNARFRAISKQAVSAKRAFMALVYIKDGRLYYETQAKDFPLADRSETVRLISEALNKLA